MMADGENIILREYLESLRLSRDILDVMLGGRSAIDTRGGLLPISDLDSATHFIEAYGYKSDEPIQAAELLGVYQESLRFIQKYFLRPGNPDGYELTIPTSFFELNDVRKLFVYVTEKDLKHAERKSWACAIIRVMHTISHLDKDIRADYLAEIQQQVFDRFYKEVHNVGETIFLGNPKGASPIELVYFQTKPRKSRDSQILKLLHKEENVAEDIYDQVGVRFVTRSRMDSLRVLKYLRDHSLVIPGNVKPSRSRNALVDPFLYRRVWREVRSQVEKNELSTPAEIDAYIEKRLLDRPMEKDTKLMGTSNPFSSDKYTAIQFTSRHLIKIRNPVYDDVKKLKSLVSKSGDEELIKYAKRVDVRQLSREQSFFYPFEVQILDARGYEEAQNGQAAHKSYKAAQVGVAALRVLGALVSREERMESQ